MSTSEFEVGENTFYITNPSLRQQIKLKNDFITIFSSAGKSIDTNDLSLFSEAFPRDEEGKQLSVTPEITEARKKLITVIAKVTSSLDSDKVTDFMFNCVCHVRCDVFDDGKRISLDDSALKNLKTESSNDIYLIFGNFVKLVLLDFLA